MSNRQLKINTSKLELLIKASTCSPHPKLVPLSSPYPLRLSKQHQHLPVTQARNWVVILDASLLVFNFRDLIMDFMKTTFNIVLPSQMLALSRTKERNSVNMIWCLCCISWAFSLGWRQGSGREVRKWSNMIK